MFFSRVVNMTDMEILRNGRVECCRSQRKHVSPRVVDEVRWLMPTARFFIRAYTVQTTCSAHCVPSTDKKERTTYSGSFNRTTKMSKSTYILSDKLLTLVAYITKHSRRLAAVISRPKKRRSILHYTIYRSRIIQGSSQALVTAKPIFGS